MTNIFKRLRPMGIAVFSGVGAVVLTVLALVFWWLPTAPIVKFQPVCDITRYPPDVPESEYSTYDNWSANLKGPMRQEFKDVIAAGYLGSFYRNIIPNESLGYYRVTPDDIYVTQDFYNNRRLYFDFTVKAIHTLIQKELWSGKSFPIRIEDNLYTGHRDSWKYLQSDPWRLEDFRIGSDLSRELNLMFYDLNGNFRQEVYDEQPDSYIYDLEFNERYCAVIRFFAIEGAPPPKNLEIALFRHIPTHSKEVNKSILQHFIDKYRRDERAR